MKYTRQQRRRIHRHAKKLLAKKEPTMQLPVSLPAYEEAVEAQVLRFAREWIANLLQNGNPWSVDSPLSAEAGQALYRHMLRIAVDAHPINRMQIIALAKLGDLGAEAALRTLLIEMKSRREPLPTELEEYNMWLILHGGNGGLLQPPARKKKDYVVRDVCIAMTVAAALDRFGHYGIKATGRSARRRSFCSIVAQAYREEAHLSLDYDAVKAIWTRYGRAMPTVPGWASK